ncbi:PASTA domain-containing protein [Micromonospora phaseoli]|uniref:PASTA domain-containing protein n=1 Tax=Micromonospora phaseoli TaxID=1144548 RepID=A0A1H7BR36_9ACTN|nr:PASTA domain-containing protein [Micromonospora phaseoli]PZV95013.1 PASTA domain-containing protein [Micromonospora phaseoli]SEJ75875.1 PASTA domain-containing protein [Micromonospora phaseoli]
MLIGGGVAAVLLAVIGAAGGWVLAGDQQGSVATPPPAATGSRTPVAETSSPPGRPTPTRPSSSPSQSRPTGLTVPELVGMDFEEAREELRDLGLGWQFVFGSGSSSSVRSTKPAPGTPVRRGITVVITVAGAAPPSEVPDLVGESCNDAKDELVEDGFSPRYPTGRSGVVTAQQPAGDTVGKWNDVVQIWCGTAPSGDESTSAR